MRLHTCNTRRRARERNATRKASLKRVWWGLDLATRPPMYRFLPHQERAVSILCDNAKPGGVMLVRRLVDVLSVGPQS